MKIKIFLLGIILMALFTACTKDEEITFDPNAMLNFSSDSVLFDTVFTSVGSTSRRLKIYNPNLQAINIEKIQLSGGNASPFSLNINGFAAPETANLKINGHDSINVFVKVNINPTSQNLPFIVEDSVLFYFNGNKHSVPLVAYGQNAIFIKGSNITSDATWDGKLPYLIYKSVTIEKEVKLTIEPGTKILFHGNATMSVKGSLVAKGSKTDSILFASDRLEKRYQDEPGQWNGIHFYPESKNSQLNYVVIKNAVAGITVDSLSNNQSPKLLLGNSIIKNMEVVGLLGYQTEISAFNNLFYNCGQYLLYGAGGGSYNLKQNTFAGFNPDFFRKTPAVYLSDYISTTQNANLKIDLYNNIIWGNLTEEFLIDKKSALTVLSSVIKNNLIKTALNTYQNNGNILNQDPSFISPLEGNFRLNKTSIATNKGLDLSLDPNFNNFLQRDLDNKTRIFPSELGSYENN